MATFEIFPKFFKILLKWRVLGQNSNWWCYVKFAPNWGEYGQNIIFLPTKSSDQKKDKSSANLQNWKISNIVETFQIFPKFFKILLKWWVLGQNSNWWSRMKFAPNWGEYCQNIIFSCTESSVQKKHKSSANLQNWKISNIVATFEIFPKFFKILLKWWVLSQNSNWWC